MEKIIGQQTIEIQFFKKSLRQFGLITKERMRLLDSVRTTEPLHLCLTAPAIPPSSYYYTEHHSEKDKILEKQKNTRV